MARAKITEDLNMIALTRAVATESGHRPDDVQVIIQATVDVVGRALAAGYKVKIPNAFTLEPSTRRLGAGSLGGRITRARTVKTVRFHLNGRLHDAIRSGRRVTTLKKAPKSS